MVLAEAVEEIGAYLHHSLGHGHTVLFRQCDRAPCFFISAHLSEVDCGSQ